MAKERKTIKAKKAAQANRKARGQSILAKLFQQAQRKSKDGK